MRSVPILILLFVFCGKPTFAQEFPQEKAVPREARPLAAKPRFALTPARINFASAPRRDFFISNTSGNTGKKAHKENRGFWFYFSPVPRSWDEGVLYAGLGADMVTTVKFMNHPRYVSSFDGSIKNSHYPGAFTEAGWARFAGNRNTAGVVALNVGLDAGIVALNRFIQSSTKGKKGGGWRILRWIGKGGLVIKGLGHGHAAWKNVRYELGWEKYLIRGRKDVFWHKKPTP